MIRALVTIRHGSSLLTGMQQRCSVVTRQVRVKYAANNGVNAATQAENQMRPLNAFSCSFHSSTLAFSAAPTTAPSSSSNTTAAAAHSSDPFLHPPQPFKQKGTGNTSKDTPSPAIPSFLHLSTRAPPSPPPTPVPLAFRRSVLGDPSHAAPVRLKTNQQFPTVPTAASASTTDTPNPSSSAASAAAAGAAPVACFNFVLLHCLLGDSKQFHMFETALHNVIKQANAKANAPSHPHGKSNSQILLHVWNVDLRNHGSSPHTDMHSYHDLIVDLYAFLQQHNIENPIICAHSQGAKTALAYSLAMSEAPENAAERRFQAKTLLILDAAPAAYTHTHSAIFDGMESVDFNDRSIKQKRDVEERLKPKLSSPTDRAFVLSNLVEDHSVPHQPRFSWRVNLPVLSRDEFNIHDWVHPPPTCPADSSRDCRPNYTGPTLFIGGGKSTRLTTAEYTRHLAAYFPNHEMQMVPSAGHFVHQSHAKECAAWIDQFLRKHTL